MGISPYESWIQSHELGPGEVCFFLSLGQTANGIITWPLLLLLRFGVEKAGGGDNTDVYVAAISFSAIAVLVAGCIPLYLFKTRHHIVFRSVLVESEAENKQDLEKADIRKPGLRETLCTIKAIFLKIINPAICA